MFSEKLYKLRTQKNVTQEELAFAVGTTRQTVSNWEVGRAAPRLGMAKRIADFFDVTVAELYDNEESLTKEEYQLVYSYRALSDTNKEIIMNTIRALL